MSDAIITDNSKVNDKLLEENEELRNEVAELKAHVERLRGAIACDVALCAVALHELETKPMGSNETYSVRRIDTEHRIQHIKLLQHIYNETPTQSLEAHDAELKRKHFMEAAEVLIAKKDAIYPTDQFDAGYMAACTQMAEELKKIAEGE